jgi:hypothetical protein
MIKEIIYYKSIYLFFFILNINSYKIFYFLYFLNKLKAKKKNKILNYSM